MTCVRQWGEVQGESISLWLHAKFTYVFTLDSELKTICMLSCYPQNKSRSFPVGNI